MQYCLQSIFIKNYSPIILSVEKILIKLVRSLQTGQLKRFCCLLNVVRSSAPKLLGSEKSSKLAWSERGELGGTDLTVP